MAAVAHREGVADELDLAVAGGRFAVDPVRGVALAGQQFSQIGNAVPLCSQPTFSGAVGRTVVSVLLQGSQDEREVRRREFEPVLRQDTRSHSGGAEALDGMVGV